MTEKECGASRAIESTFIEVKHLFEIFTQKLAAQEQMLDENRKLAASLVSEFVRHTPQSRDDAARQMADQIFARVDSYIDYKTELAKASAAAGVIPRETSRIPWYKRLLGAH